MRGWRLVFGVLAGVALVALVLRATPPYVFVPLVVVGIVYGTRRYRASKRVQKESAEADTLGLEQSPVDRFGLLGLPLQLLGRGGDERVVENVMWGPQHGVDVKVFDFRYRSEEDATGGEDRRFLCVLLPIEADLPPLVVEPRTFFTPPAERAALEEVVLDPEGFGDAFEVRAADPAFAQAVLHPEMRAWLGDLDEDLGFEVSGRLLLCYAPQPNREIPHLLDAAAGFGRRLSTRV